MFRYKTNYINLTVFKYFHLSENKLILRIRGLIFIRLYVIITVLRFDIDLSEFRNNHF